MRFTLFLIALLPCLAMVAAVNMQPMSQHAQAVHQHSQAIHQTLSSVHVQMMDSHKQFLQAKLPAVSLNTARFQTSAVSQDCKTALTNLGAVHEGACGKQLDELTDTRKGAKVGVFKQFCTTGNTPNATTTASCFSQIQTVVDSAATKCADQKNDDGTSFDAKELLTINAAIRVMCIQDSAGQSDEDKYCFPKFQKTVDDIDNPKPEAQPPKTEGPAPSEASSASSSDGKFTPANIKKICSPCSIKIINEMQSTGFINSTSSDDGSVTGALNLICTSDEEGFCYDRFTTAMNKMGNPGTADFGFFCTSCFRRMFNGLPAKITKETGPVFDALGKNCAFNPDGGNCLAKFGPFLNFTATFFEKTGCGKENACADTKCASRMASFISDQSCCFAANLNVLNDIVIGLAKSSEKKQEKITVEQFQTVTCGNSIQGACSKGTKKVQYKAKLANLKYAYYTANTAKVTAALKKDIAAASGTLEANVAINSVGAATTTAAHGFRVMATDGGVTVDSTVSVDTTAQQTAASTSLTSPSLTFTSVDGLGADSKNNPTASTTATGASTSTYSSSANGIKANLFAIVNVMAVVMAIIAFAL